MNELIPLLLLLVLVLTVIVLLVLILFGKKRKKVKTISEQETDDLVGFRRLFSTDKQGGEVL